jgi:short-subunit dehydrogenase
VTVTLVTGASSGIGRALAEEFGRQGDHVVVVARREPLLHEVAAAITARGGHATVVSLDVGDTARTVSAFEALDDHLGGIDRVIAAAAVGPANNGPSFAWSTIAGACHVNFCGAAASLAALAPRMAARRRGHLVGLSSISSFGALPGSGAYCAPKAGLSMLLECLRLDLAPHGVAVTTVHAGFVDTAMVAHREGAMPGLMSPEDAAAHIVAALARRPARIDFPLTLALAARAAALVPRALRDKLVRRVVK